MKKLILLSLLISTTISAEPFPSQKPVVCEDKDIVMEALKEKYNEHVVWMGKDIKNGNMYLLTANEKESTWTYIETNGVIACVLGAGTKSTPKFGEQV